MAEMISVLPLPAVGVKESLNLVPSAFDHVRMSPSPLMNECGLMVDSAASVAVGFQIVVGRPTVADDVAGFTTALHRSVSWADWIQFTPSQHISVKRSLVLFCHIYSVNRITFDFQTWISGWRHSWYEIMLSLWQNFVWWWLFKSVGIWLCIVGWAVPCILKDCILFTVRVRRFLKMPGTACPLTHCCIPEDLSLNNTGVRTWNLALYLMFTLILLYTWR